MMRCHHHFPVIDSTNNFAKQNAHTFDPTALTIISADEQTAGRGRFNRQWVSPPGQNLYLTFCFFLERRSDLGNLPQILALSACRLLEEQGFAPKIKWPNDLLLSGKKLGGILCETVMLGNQLCVVLGIGLNLNMPKELLDSVDRPATSLLIEGGKEVDRHLWQSALETHFNEDLGRFLKQGFAPFLESFRKRLVPLPGEPVRFHERGELIEGTFHALNPDGSLSLRLASGELMSHLAEIVLGID